MISSPFSLPLQAVRLGFGVAAVFAAGTAAAAQPMTFYGTSLGQSASNCGAGRARPQLTVVAQNAGTTWSATQLTNTALGGGTISTAYGTATLALPTTAQQIKVTTSDVAYVLINSTCGNASGSLTYPAFDGIATVGSRFVFYDVYANATNNFVAAVGGAATATVTNPAGTTVAGPQAIAAGGAWQPSGLTAGQVYIITSTGGDIAVGSGSINAYALLAAAGSRAASCENDVSTQFFGSILAYTGNTGVAVFNDGAAATVTLTQLTGGNNTYTINAAANATTYSSSPYADGTYRFDSTGPVSIWAGSPEGANAIDNLGDDIAVAMPAFSGGTFRLRSHAQSTSRVFAAQGSTVTVNGTNTAVGASQNFAVTAGTDVVITSSTPFLFESINTQNQNDWGKWLRPLPPVDSDGDGVPDTIEAPGGGCQSTAPDSDFDGVPDFLDTDSDNDCLPDSDPNEAGAARTDPTLPAGPHCSGNTPVCGVPPASTVGVCQACSGDYGSGTPRACPISTAPICTAAGACVACGGSYGSGAANACPSASAPICTGGACGPCDGNYGSGSSAACTVSTAPFCSGGQCMACNGAFGSGTTQACNVATEPVCTSIGACLACNGGFGSGQSLACQRAATPVCAANGSNAGACTACDGDNGSGSAAPCETTANPYCFLSGANAGTCGKCSGNADCAGHPNGNVCNAATGGCGTTCFGDADCNSATKWCAAGVCTGKTPNGQPIPNVNPVNGHCDAANGARVCLSGVCSTQDDTCGLKAGEACSDPDGGLDGGANAECQSGLCAPTGRCAACVDDLECGGSVSGKVCNDSSKTCIDGCRGTGGNTCPSPEVCSSKDRSIGSCSTPGQDAGVDAGRDAAVADARADATSARDGASEGGQGNDNVGVLEDEGSFGGGGIGCTASSSSGGSAAAGALVALTALGVARRRRKRS